MIPLYFHIPKCAGTYVISAQLLLLNEKLRRFGNGIDKEKISKIVKNIEITKNSSTILRIIATDYQDSLKNFEPSLNDLTHFKIDEKNLDDIIEKINIFSLNVEPHGFYKWQTMIEKIKSKYSILPWIIIRNPYDRLQSLFNYIKSEESSHEKIIINSKTFEEYIISDEFPSCWFIKSFLNLSETHMPTNQDLDNIKNILNDFYIKDIKEVDQAINNVFEKCHKINLNNIKEKSKALLNFNKSKTEKRNIDDLDDKSKYTFLYKEKAEIELFNFLIDK